MNPFLLEVIAMLIRSVGLYLAGAIGQSDWAAAHMSEIQQYSTSGAVFVTMAGLAAWAKFKGRQKLLTATVLADMTEHEVEMAVKDPLMPTPSVTTPKSEVPR